MIEHLEVELVADLDNLCGEGPLWQADRRRLVWLDIEAGRMFAYDPTADRAELLEDRLPASSVARCADGALLIAGGDRLTRWRDGEMRPISLHTGEHDLTGFNDLCVDQAGRLYLGTIHWEGERMIRPGAVYRIDPDRTVHRLAGDVQLANGLGFSPDGRTFYLTDSVARTIWAYDADPATGAIANRRAFATVPPAWGLPDGLDVDADGCVWSALWYGSQVVRFDPTGRAERRIPLPVQQVSSVAFGGEDLTDLYITSAAAPWPSAFAPPAFNPHHHVGGALYRLHTDIRGRPQPAAAL